VGRVPGIQSAGAQAISCAATDSVSLESALCPVLSIPPAIQPLWHAAAWVLIAVVTTVVSLLMAVRLPHRITPTVVPLGEPRRLPTRMSS
jgi:hypothetical protein